MKREVICGIYKIISPKNRIYIGQSNNIYYRWNAHLCWDKRKKYINSNIRLHNSFRKYGVKNHKFEILEFCEIEQLNEREAYFVKFYDTFETDHGLNLTSGGDCCKFSEETRKKLSIAFKGRPGNNKGKKFSDEHREKIRISLLGKKRSEESKENISKAHLGQIPWNKGKELTDEHKKKISLSAELNPNYGMRNKKPSEEHKIKIGLGNKGKKRTPETIEKYRLANIGRKQRPESREKRRQSMIGKNKGKKYGPLSEERRKKISEKLIGNTHTKGKKQRPETIEKRRKSMIGKNKGRKHTEETRKNMSEAQKRFNERVRQEKLTMIF